jgi:hypothetical protein
MIDKLLEFLQTVLGKTVVGLVLFFVLGIGAVAIYDDCVCTESEKDLIYIAMEKGDSWTKLDIIQWKLDQAKDELIRLQNHIDINQRGVYTDSQRSRIQQLNKRIGELEAQKTQLFNTLKQQKR